VIDPAEQVLADLGRVLQVTAQLRGHLQLVLGEPVVGKDSLDALDIGA